MEGDGDGVDEEQAGEVVRIGGFRAASCGGGASSSGVGPLWIPIQIGREEGGVVGRVGVGVG